MFAVSGAQACNLYAKKLQPQCALMCLVANSASSSSLTRRQEHSLRCCHVLLSTVTRAATVPSCRCATLAADTDAALKVNYPCAQGLSSILVVNRKDQPAKILSFRVVFTKNLNGVFKADYVFAAPAAAAYVVPGPN